MLVSLVVALHDASFEFCPVKTILKSYVIVSFNSPVIKSAPKLSTVNLSLYSPVRLAEKVNESVSYSKLNDLLISTIINHGANINPSIIEQSTIKRIIELQYQRIKPLIGL